MLQLQRAELLQAGRQPAVLSVAPPLAQRPVLQLVRLVPLVVQWPVR